MQTFPKKEIRIICERPILKRVQDHLSASGVKGYTVFPAMAGRGSEGDWERSGMIGDAGQMVMIIAILDAAQLDVVLEDIFSVINPQIGVITVSDVAVVRPERF